MNPCMVIHTYIWRWFHLGRLPGETGGAIVFRARELSPGSSIWRSSPRLDEGRLTAATAACIRFGLTRQKPHDVVFDSENGNNG